jgi:AraC-like DNA-binding protein
MIFPLDSVRPPDVWQYGRRRDGTESAVWNGNSSLPLACHFHQEIQITAVLAGRRRFLASTGAVIVNAGETFIIPPGLPHQALGLEAEGTLSLNFYLNPEGIPLRRNAILVQTPRWLRIDMPDDSPMLSDWAHGALRRSSESPFHTASGAIASLLAGNDTRIGDVASAHGLSREGFIRSFHRSVGMTPHAYRLAFRLNRARALLATDVAPAEAAAEAGFADQSHLGRHFRLAFGATPGAYRCAVRT